MNQPERRLRALARLLHKVYKLSLSRLCGDACRFRPYCSDYALEAVERYGWLAGGWLACKRVMRCHPLHPGGHDPVP